MKKFIIVQNSVKTTSIFRSGYIKELLKHGSVSVIAPNDDKQSKVKLESMGVVVHKVSINRLLSILQMNLLIFKERAKGSVIICHFLVTFLFCFPTLVPFNKKLVVYTEGLGSIFTKRNFLRRILKFILVNNSAIRLFCNTSERKLIGLKKDLVTNGIGIDLSTFKRKKRNCLQSGFNLLYVGRLIADKGVIDVVDSFRILKSIRKDVTLNLVGDIYPNNPSSLSEADINLLKNEFGRSINFVGFTHNVLYWYEKSDLLLLPSKREGFPVCVMEASAIGIPTIGYDVIGVKDAIKPGINGELVKYGDVYGIAKTANSILNHKCLSTYLNTANKYAKEKFCSKEKNSELVNILTSL